MIAAWSPKSWREKPIAQQPAYPDPAALETVETELHDRSPLVSADECRELTSHLAENLSSPDRTTRISR